MRHPLEEWIRTLFGWHSKQGMDDAFMVTVASALRIPVVRTYKIGGISEQIFAALSRNEDLYLDYVEVCRRLSATTKEVSLRNPGP